MVVCCKYYLMTVIGSFANLYSIADQLSDMFCFHDIWLQNFKLLKCLEQA